MLTSYLKLVGQGRWQLAIVIGVLVACSADSSGEMSTGVPSEGPAAGGPVASGASAPTAAVDGGGPVGTIAFHADPNGVSGLYAMNGDGSDVRLVSETLAGHPFAVWSPDGSRLAFLSGSFGVGTLYVVNADGTNEQRASSHSVGSFTWSPDGSELVYEVADGGGLWVVLIDDGGEPRQLTPSGFVPSVSSDGEWVAYFDGTEDQAEIYVTHLSAGPERLTQNNAADLLPVWSPDGSQIAFLSDRDGNSELYVMNRDGSDQRRLTEDPAPDEGLKWHPEGDRLLYVSYRDGANPLDLGIGNAEVFVVDVETGTVTNLTNNPAWDGDASWSPDGSWIVFTRRTDHGEIYTMRSDGSAQTMHQGFASPEFNDCCAAWGP